MLGVRRFARFPPLEAEYCRADGVATFMQYLVESLHVRQAAFRVVDDAFGAHVVLVKADQCMPAVRNQQGVVEWREMWVAFQDRHAVRIHRE